MRKVVDLVIAAWFASLWPKWLCRLIARQMHAANGSYPNARLAAVIRQRAGIPDPYAKYAKAAE